MEGLLKLNRKIYLYPPLKGGGCPQCQETSNSCPACNPNVKPLILERKTIIWGCFYLRDKEDSIMGIEGMCMRLGAQHNKVMKSRGNQG